MLGFGFGFRLTAGNIGLLAFEIYANRGQLLWAPAGIPEGDAALLGSYMFRV